MKRTTLFTLTFLLTHSINAQTYLDSFNIKSHAPDSNPSSFVTDDAGTTLYFVAQEPTYGREIWSFTGTDTFPQRLTDINPGSTYSVSGEPQSMYFMNGTLYFAGYDTAKNTELFSYKPGQSATLIEDIDTGANRGSFPKRFQQMNGKLYFTARTLTIGYELMEYDPVTNKVRLLGNLNPGHYDSDPKYLTPFNNKLYYQGTNTNTGTELYMFDPVADSISLVADIEPGADSSNPEHLIVYNNKLYFTAFESSTGFELYEYDGTNPPKRLTDIAAGTANGVYNPSGICIYNSKIFFSGFDGSTSNFQLYSFDPANNNVTKEFSINSTANPMIGNLTVYYPKLFFSATTTINGQELWSFDGSSAKLEADIYPGNTGSNITELKMANNSLFFSAKNPTYGIELFRYSYYPLTIGHAATGITDCTIYPNPAYKTAYLKVGLQKKESLSVTVTDMQGRVVYSSGNELYSEGTHTINIPLNNLASGNYLYQLNSKERLLTTGKFIKQ